MCDPKANSNSGTMCFLPMVDSLSSINTSSTFDSATCNSSTADLTDCDCSVTTTHTGACSTKKVRFAPRHKTNLYYRRGKANETWLSKQIPPKNKLRAATWQVKDEKVASLIKGDAFANPNIQNLAAFSSLSGDDCLRGLENYICKDFGDCRMHHKRNYVIALIDLETQLKHQGHLSREEIAEKLAECSRQYSQQATNFARALGKADEYATNGELQDLACTCSCPRRAQEGTNFLIVSLLVSCVTVGAFGLACSALSLGSVSSLSSFCQ